MYKILKFIFFIIAVLILFFLLYFFTGSAKEQKNITWGVNFSQMYSEYLGLDWKENYKAILDDLGVKNIKLLTHWDFVEPLSDIYHFEDIDWQLARVKNRNVKIIYVLGMKTGRWPECHIPNWAKNLSKAQQQKEILEYIGKTVLRYKNSPAIVAWQVENEPLFEFGQCPWHDKEFLKKEVELVKSLDGARSVIISDSGEYSLWVEAAQLGDVVGTTMYRKVWAHITDETGFYAPILFSPASYYRKAQIIKAFLGKKVINVELQAEPWTNDGFLKTAISEQGKTMNLEQFKNNIEFAKKSGLDTFYLWGAEWWFWMKEKHGQPEIWEEAKQLFQENN